MNVRQVLILVNLIAIVIFGGAAILLLRRNRTEERTPANLTPFLGDEDLEGRRLERVLGWALICAAVIAVTLPLYWLREPNRQEQTIEYFEEGAIERGEALFASPGMEAYDSTLSLQCANCHGADGSGGAAPWIYTDPDTNKAQKVQWKAPPLNTELLRFSEEEVREIITYGRPGTPMQGFGVEGGGPKNEQSIGDLIAYIHSIQLTPEESQAQAAEALTDARGQAENQLADAQAVLKDTRAQLVKVRAGDDDSLSVAEAAKAVEDAEASVAWAEDWLARRQNISDGQHLYELYCARCHTQGWSLFDSLTPGLTSALGRAGAGGSLGFNLTNEKGRFHDPATQNEFVSTGSEAFKPYGDTGNTGNGSGKMPGFGLMLTQDMIEAIVEYERNCLSVTDPSQPAEDQLQPSDVPACLVATATVQKETP